MSPIITCICQGLRIVPNVAAGCLSPMPLFTIPTSWRIYSYVYRPTVSQSVSQLVGTSVSQLGRFDVQRGSLYANWRLFVTPTQRSSQRLSPRRVGNCNSSTFEFTFEQRLRAQIITVIAACWSRRHPVGRSSYYYYYNCSCIFYQWIECCTHMRASRQPPLHPPWSSSVTRKT